MDISQRSIKIVQQAVRGKDPHAVTLARKRSEKLTPKRRKEIASQGGKASAMKKANLTKVKS